MESHMDSLSDSTSKPTWNPRPIHLNGKSVYWFKLGFQICISSRKFRDESFHWNHVVAQNLCLIWRRFAHGSTLSSIELSFKNSASKSALKIHIKNASKSMSTFKNLHLKSTQKCADFRCRFCGGFFHNKNLTCEHTLSLHLHWAEGKEWATRLGSAYATLFLLTYQSKFLVKIHLSVEHGKHI